MPFTCPKEGTHCAHLLSIEVVSSQDFQRHTRSEKSIAYKSMYLQVSSTVSYLIMKYCPFNMIQAKMNAYLISWKCQIVLWLPDYPKWLAAYLATCEAFHIVKKDCTESNIMMGEPGRARIKHFAACRFYWYNTDSRCLLPAHSCKLRAWLNLGKQEVYSKREKSEQRSSCFPCSSPVLPPCSLENYDVCFVYSGGFRCLTVELWNAMICYASLTRKSWATSRRSQSRTVWSWKVQKTTVIWRHRKLILALDIYTQFYIYAFMVYKWLLYLSNLNHDECHRKTKGSSPTSVSHARARVCNPSCRVVFWQKKKRSSPPVARSSELVGQMATVVTSSLRMQAMTETNLLHDSMIGLLSDCASDTAGIRLCLCIWASCRANMTHEATIQISAVGIPYLSTLEVSRIIEGSVWFEHCSGHLWPLAHVRSQQAAPSFFQGNKQVKWNRTIREITREWKRETAVKLRGGGLKDQVVFSKKNSWACMSIWHVEGWSWLI